MPKRWKDEQELLDSLSEALVKAMSMFPKRIVKVDELVHEYHMPLSHIQILALVEDRSRSIGQLSTLLGIAKPNITPLVDTLNSRGLVERIRSEQDRRIVLVHILPAGEACLRDIRASVSQQLTAWPESLSRGDIRELLNALNTITQTIGKMEQSGR
ncbi:MAG: winged helix-turn-helix transcriptional regulator [Clostridia bacterium]|nr:winged helix-turn-helix transcriptional regulator [Clostridia bacterium]